MKSKIKSYGFWVGLSGAAVIALNAISKSLGFNIDSKIAEDIIMGICGVLVALGIVCAPIKTEEDKTLKEEQNCNKDQPPKEESNNNNLTDDQNKNNLNSKTQNDNINK